jgi:hypothetical protein
VNSDNISIVYDWTVASNLLSSLKGGVAKINDTMTLGQPNLPQVIDNYWYNGGVTTGSALQQQNPYLRGGFGRYNPHDTGETDQLKADLSWFLNNHNLKFGFSRIESKYHRTAATSGGFWYTVRADGQRLDARQQTDDSEVKATFDALYAQDSWDVTDGLKVFYGLRYESQAQKDPQGRTFMKFDSFSDYTQPRVGFTWDPEANGRNKISGSFARYFEMIPQRLAARVYGNEVYFRDRWTNGNADPAQTFVYSSTGRGVTSGTPSFSDFATPYARDPIAEGTKLPRRTEYTLGYERVLDNGFTAGLHGKFRKFDNIIEDSVIRGAGGSQWTAYDDQERAILWNPGPTATWTDQDGRRHVATQTFFDKAKNVYQSVDFTLDKRTERYYVNFSYTWSRLEGNYEGLITSSNGQADASITASWDEWPYVGSGLLPLDRTNVIKLLASYNWPVGPGTLSLGATWVYQTGTPLSLFDDGSYSHGQVPGFDTANTDSNNNVVDPVSSKTLYHTLDIEGYGNAVPANGQLGQMGRTPCTNNVDLRLDYSWKVARKVVVSPSFELFNLFNTRQATRFLEEATDDNGLRDERYGQATDWLRGRRVRFGLKVSF